MAIHDHTLFCHCDLTFRIINEGGIFCSFNIHYAKNSFSYDCQAAIVKICGASSLSTRICNNLFSSPLQCSCTVWLPSYCCVVTVCVSVLPGKIPPSMLSNLNQASGHALPCTKQQTNWNLRVSTDVSPITFTQSKSTLRYLDSKVSLRTQKIHRTSSKWKTYSH